MKQILQNLNSGDTFLEDIVNDKTGEIFVEAGVEITQAVLDQLEAANVKDLPTLGIDHFAAQMRA